MERTRLVDRIDTGVHGAVTLVSAPAGSGKSTLLAEWLHSREGEASWLSLDQADNDPSLFWAYFVAALQRFEEGVGDLALAMLHSLEPLPAQAFLSTLINDVNAVQGDMVVVLDDYHIIERPEIHEGMSFFIDRMPPHLHLVLVSRAEPSLPLARLRGQGKLTEIPAGDLRFTVDETAEFFSGAVQVPVSTQTISELERRTEGWIAGLKLAALSMQGREDTDGFLSTFSGDHRYIADFLLEEVLQGQPVEVREFLLQSAHLQRLCGPLCDAVMDRTGSADILSMLEQQQLFVIPLDDKRYWYRYHHLFGDVLASLLQSEKPVLVPALHRRACAWFESEGHEADAIRHALAAKDNVHAADLVERSWRRMDRSFQADTWLSWAECIPENIILGRPVLSACYGWALLDTLQFDRAEKWVDHAEDLLDRASDVPVVVADEREYASLPATIAAARAYLAQAKGDIEATEQYARKTLELLPPDDHFYRAIPLVTLGLAQWRRGDLNEAWTSMSEALERFEFADNLIYAQRCHYALAELRLCQGRLTEGLASYERAAADNYDSGGPDVRRGVARVMLERGDLVGAEALMTENSTYERASARWYQVEADIAALSGDLERAVAVMDEAVSAPASERIPSWMPAASHRARLLLQAGRLEEVGIWARASGLSLDDSPSFSTAYDLAAYARWCLASGIGDVRNLLDVLANEAERSGRTGLLVDVNLQQARCSWESGDTEETRTRLADALDRAAPDGFVAPFLRESDMVGTLLPDMVAKGLGRDHAIHVLSALTARDEKPDVSTRTNADLLSPRELEVLRLIAAGLRNQDIADQLFISLATVKRHIANIYGKLEASHRTDAIIKARETGIL